MRQLDVARQWASKANLALQEANISALVTLTGEEANGYLNSGSLVCLVEVEKANFETWTATEFALRFIIISPVQDMLQAWAQLDEMTDALKDPLELESAQLSMWQPENGKPYPCLLLTTTTTEIEE